MKVAAPDGDVRVTDSVPEAFASAVLEAFESRPSERFSLVLSGGPTARRCYEELSRTDVYPVDWAAVDVYMGDERCVPPDDPDANQRLVREALLDRVGAHGAFEPMSCDEGPEEYSRLLAEAGELDVVHLGMGADGHTASLFPGSDDLEAPPEVLALKSTDPNGVNPHPRMSMTLGAIARARLVVFTISGAEKHDAFVKVMSRDDVPATRVTAQSVLWIADPAAAGS